jgi:hypothetical protein
MEFMESSIYSLPLYTGIHTLTVESPKVDITDKLLKDEKMRKRSKRYARHLYNFYTPIAA